MEMGDHTELIAASEEGLSAEDVEAPPSTLRRRAGLATVGFAGLVFFALAVKKYSAQSSHSMTTSDFTVLLEKNVVSQLGRPLTGQERMLLSETQARNLDATVSAGSATPECQKAFGAHLLKMVGKAGAAAFKVLLSCHDPDSDGCTSAKEEAEQLKADMDAECVEEPSTDLCTQTKDGTDAEVCIPKACQSDADLSAISKGGSTISCGGGGFLAPVMNALHLR